MQKFLLIFLIAIKPIYAFNQAIPYGNNPVTGKYFNVGDARIYYEVYGSGRPLLLLHGDTFGYIDEFDQYIPLLSKYFKVIAVGMRGHGKSEIGTKPYSYDLFAADALSILQQETTDTAVIIGFSAGAITALHLVADNPKQFRKVVILGGMLDKNGYNAQALSELSHLTGTDCEKILPARVKELKALMPEPDRYEEVIVKLRSSWLQPVYTDIVKAQAISCPVLVVSGDRDEYIRLDESVRIYKAIPHAQLAVIPNCGHVGLIMQPVFFSDMIIPFLLQ